MTAPKKPTSAPAADAPLPGSPATPRDPRIDNAGAHHLTAQDREMLNDVYALGFSYLAFAHALAKQVAALAQVHPAFRAQLDSALRNSADPSRLEEKWVAMRLTVEYERARDEGSSPAEALERLAVTYGRSAKTISGRLTAAWKLLGTRPRRRHRQS